LQTLLNRTFLKNTLSFFLFFLISCSPKTTVTDYVDPFIGTDGTGHTFPGPTMPFGMVQLSPDTRDGGWDNCSGYHSSNSTILGFSHTHLSGTGAMDYGDILIVPATGELQLDPGSEANPESGYRSRFRNETEVAKPGYYAVTLDDHGIRAELTTTSRVGFHRYTFPKGSSPHVIIDLVHGLGDRPIETNLNIVGSNKVTGMRRSTGWAKDQYIYFTAEFSQPFSSFGISDSSGFIEEKKSGSGAKIKGAFFFDERKDPLLIKVAISAVDIPGAEKNMNAELPGWGFDDVRDQALDAWKKELSVIDIPKGDTVEKIIFYSALYHSFIAPNIFCDVDGRYRGADLQIHKAEKESGMYTVFSLWDTFRAAHPLYTLIKPGFAEDLVRTLLTKQKEGGLLPVWELAGNETGTMIGYHSIPVIADAYVKGLRNFDIHSALDAMIFSAEQDHLGLSSYKQEGYIALEEENESVSKTLEYAYDDWCIAIMADSLGKQDVANHFYRRSLNYQNAYDPKTGFMRGKKYGGWDSPFDPFEVNATFTEANSWQYSFFAPHDTEGLIRLMGGNNLFIAKLDSLFSVSPNLTGRHQPDITGLIGQYAHGNEPSHQFAYLYTYAGEPWKTQEKIRQIIDDLYTSTRDGLCGNEDCGQMSSWYVFSALGFYPVTPGKDYYVFGAPHFESAEIHLENGETFSVRAPKVSSKNKYIQSVKLNGKPYTKLFIRHQDIMNGGELFFRMGTRPNKKRGANSADLPESNLPIRAVINPVVEAPAKAFLEPMTITIKNMMEDAIIHYTTDGSNPDESSPIYSEPFQVNQSSLVQAVAVKDGFYPSYVEKVKYYKLPYKISINYHEPYSAQYTAGGDRGLFDSIRGIPTAWGAWQGWFGPDLDATIDLGKVREVQSVTATFLQNAGSWIWLPKFVSFSISKDGKRFRKIKQLTHDIPLKEYEPTILDFKAELDQKIQFIRIHAKNIESCPEWHPGAENPAWIFIDEIVIE